MKQEFLNMSYEELIDYVMEHDTCGELINEEERR